MYASALVARREGVQAELACDREGAVGHYLQASRQLAEARNARFQKAWSRGETDEGEDLRALQKEVESRAEYLMCLDSSVQACPIPEHLSEWPEDSMSIRQGAACAGAALGAVLGGAPVAVCAAAGAAYMAGDSSSLAAQAGEATSSAVGSLRYFNDRHDISGHAWDAAAQATAAAQHANREYDISGHAYRASVAVVEGVQYADRELDISGKAYQAASTVASGLWTLTESGVSYLRR
eukprot:TRINITY_DN70095_c0_g1_i1.p1 TRINITY_DN70095_c0_g1~~TRINITY_DN70095_c0_g1_i1.p1  ORF type:complete len:237 (-),score=59.11 TRINITY_DN70095_c0_g1_i1:45-755(-)